MSARVADGDLAEVVRRDVRGHADGDPARAVDEQVRQLDGSTVGWRRRPS